MGTISLGQIVIVSLLLILIFGDVSQILKKFKLWFQSFKLQKKNRKKGS